MIRVMVVEDRAEVRRGLVTLLAEAPGCCAVGDFGDAESALGALAVVPTDVILMDIGLPGMSGIDATRLVRERFPGTQVMMLTVYEDESRVIESLRAGATGYVLKTTPADRLVEAITALHAGGSPMSSTIARRVVSLFRETPRTHAPEAELTPREREILDLLMEGYRYKEIAGRLGISLDTVRTHIRHVYEKLQVRSRGEAAARVLGRGGDGGGIGRTGR